MDADQAINELADRYQDAVSMLKAIAIRTRDMGDLDLGKYMKSILPELRTELLRHGKEV